jgi:hypothetical protein
MAFVMSWSAAAGLMLVIIAARSLSWPYACHQVPEPGTALGRELVSGVAEIAEVQTRLVEVAPP